MNELSSCRTSRRRGRVVAVITALVSFGLAVAAVVVRPGDSAHAIGLLSANGGTARHPVSLAPGEGLRTLIVTATVLPPFRGDAAVVVEGEPPARFEIHASQPVVDLHLRHTPRFLDGVFHDLLPGDHLALWVKLRPPVVDPVCGHPRPAAATAVDGGDPWFCSAACRDAFAAHPEVPRRGRLEGRYAVVFRETAGHRPVLTVPVVFGGKGGENRAHH
jgi:YHS domain-containing protein